MRNIIIYVHIEIIIYLTLCILIHVNTILNSERTFLWVVSHDPSLREVFDICSGDDLEMDSTKAYHVATLLGCLMIVMEQMPTMLSKEDKEVFKQKSMSTFAMLNYPKCEQQNTSDT